MRTILLAAALLAVAACSDPYSNTQKCIMDHDPTGQLFRATCPDGRVYTRQDIEGALPPAIGSTMGTSTRIGPAVQPGLEVWPCHARTDRGACRLTLSDDAGKQLARIDMRTGDAVINDSTAVRIVIHATEKLP